MHFNKCDLDRTKLPTKRNLIEYLMFVKHKGTPDIRKNLNLNVYASFVSHEIIKLWQHTKIPIVPQPKVRKLILGFVKSYRDVVRHSRYVEGDWNQLFIISQCKCFIKSTSTSCNCPTMCAIPESEKDFFFDQYGPRLRSLQSLQNTPPEQVENVEVQSSENPTVEYDDDIDMPELFVVPAVPTEPTVPSVPTEPTAPMPSHESVITESSLSTADPSAASTGYVPGTSSEAEFQAETGTSSLKVSDIRLRNYSAGLDRSETSHRFGSLLATNLIKDISLSVAEKAKEDFSPDIAAKLGNYLSDIIIDQNKIKRERKKFREEALAAANTDRLLKGLSFDGKKDVTLKTQNKRIKENHITLLKEPGSKFIGYTTSINESSPEQTRVILEFLEKENYSLDHLVAVNCDGTPTNTGHVGGIVRLLEKRLKRPLHYFVCLFHFNELPSKALVKHFFGGTKGPGTYSGDFEADIEKCLEYPVSLNFDLN